MIYENISDLLKQISLGEDSVLELKAVAFNGNNVIGPHKDGMADELAAMAKACRSLSPKAKGSRVGNPNTDCWMILS